MHSIEAEREHIAIQYSNCNCCFHGKNMHDDGKQCS